MLAKDPGKLAADSRIVIDQAITQSAPIDAKETQERVTHVRRAGFAPEAEA